MHYRSPYGPWKYSLAMEIELSGVVAEDAALFPTTARIYDYWRGLPPPPCWCGVDPMALTISRHRFSSSTWT